MGHQPIPIGRARLDFSFWKERRPHRILHSPHTSNMEDHFYKQQPPFPLNSDTIPSGSYTSTQPLVHMVEQGGGAGVAIGYRDSLVSVGSGSNGVNSNGHAATHGSPAHFMKPPSATGPTAMIGPPFDRSIGTVVHRFPPPPPTTASHSHPAGAVTIVPRATATPATTATTTTTMTMAVPLAAPLAAPQTVAGTAHPPPIVPSSTPSSSTEDYFSHPVRRERLAMAAAVAAAEQAFQQHQVSGFDNGNGYAGNASSGIGMPNRNGAIFSNEPPVMQQHHIDGTAISTSTQYQRSLNKYHPYGRIGAPQCDHSRNDKYQGTSVPVYSTNGAQAHLHQHLNGTPSSVIGSHPSSASMTRHGSVDSSESGNSSSSQSSGQGKAQHSANLYYSHPPSSHQEPYRHLGNRHPNQCSSHGASGTSVSSCGGPSSSSMRSIGNKMQLGQDDGTTNGFNEKGNGFNGMASGINCNDTLKSTMTARNDVGRGDFGSANGMDAEAFTLEDPVRSYVDFMNATFQGPSMNVASHGSVMQFCHKAPHQEPAPSDVESPDATVPLTQAMRNDLNTFFRNQRRPDPSEDTTIEYVVAIGGL